MKPLAGMRVVEMGNVVLAPYAGCVLADLGAEVVKIESAGGDSTRSLGHAEHPGMAALFLNCNRGKESVVMDLTKPAALAAFDKLIAGADIFLHNMRADSAERLGVGYARLSKINPRLVYCATYGYGAAGRGARRPAYDDIIQAGCGLAEIKTRVDGQPGYAPTIVADKTTALFAVIGILGALRERDRTGEGRQIEVPMFETMIGYLSVEHLNGLTWQEPRAPSGYTRLLGPYRRPHMTKDGWLAVMPHSESQWKKFFTTVGRPDVLTDPRFATQALRTRNIQELYEVVGEVLPTRTTAEWTELFVANDVPFGPVHKLEDLIVDEHLADVGFWHEVEHPDEGRLRVPSFPVRDGGPGGDATPAMTGAPRLGEHTASVLQRLGYGPADVAAMVAEGAVKTG